MATQFEIDCALIAGVAYRSTRDQINRFPVPTGWGEITEFYRNLPSGFKAVSFRNTSDPNEIVISFAGTYSSPTDLRDLEADVALATGNMSDQLLQAAEYYLQVKAANPNATITLTGHSLGGGLAALIGVFFGVQAVTFDQAPFAKSAEAGVFDPAFTLMAQLQVEGYSASDLAGLDKYLDDRQNNGGIPNSDLVSNIRVDGEFISSLPTNVFFDTIGTTSPEDVLDHGPYSDPSLDMHSMALLTAFMESQQTATNGQTLNEVTTKLTDLLGMIFDESLFAHTTDPSNTTDVNFLEQLIQNQTADGGMVTNFTTDMWQIAQDGGLTMANNDLTKALIAFDMPAYYDNCLGPADSKDWRQAA